MLTEQEKKKLTNHIYKLMKESIAENGYFENFFGEKKEGNDDKPSAEDKQNYENKKDAVLRWLDTAQELHSVLAYELWPDMDEDSARSEFSKKYRGHDDDDKPYHFTDEEINDLYDMKDDFIKRIK